MGDERHPPLVGDAQGRRGEIGERLVVIGIDGAPPRAVAARVIGDVGDPDREDLTVDERIPVRIRSELCPRSLGGGHALRGRFPAISVSVSPDEATRLVGRRPGTEVIADVLDDHPDVFVDDIHTNEVGARIVAERIWESLEEPVRRAR